MFRNLIFDWSGTLVDDLGPVIEATNAVFERHGLEPLGREEFRRRFRLPYVDFYDEHLPGVPMAELEDCFRAAFASAKSEVTVLPHAREKLAWCGERGIRAFVLTSMDADAFRAQLEKFGLERAFEATYAGVIDKRAMIHHILVTHGLDPARTALVGDMIHDVETARHGGVVSVAVLTGYTHPEVLAQARPDLTVPDLAVLRGLMERAWPVERPVATAGVLVHDGEGRVLLLRTRKWSGLWGIPGGKIERGERSAEAARREVMEETGLRIDEPLFVMVQDCIDSPEFERPAHFLLMNYVARAEGTEVTLNHEAEESRWVPVSEVLAWRLNRPTRELFVECLARGLVPGGQPEGSA